MAAAGAGFSAGFGAAGGTAACCTAGGAGGFAARSSYWLVGMGDIGACSQSTPSATLAAEITSTMKRTRNRMRRLRPG